MGTEPLAGVVPQCRGGRGEAIKATASTDVPPSERPGPRWAGALGDHPSNLWIAVVILLPRTDAPYARFARRRGGSSGVFHRASATARRNVLNLRPVFHVPGRSTLGREISFRCSCRYASSLCVPAGRPPVTTICMINDIYRTAQREKIKADSS